ncbi:MAG: TonB-dependent receptor plug domain-containing protein [Bacteroidetes bacterium]|nr:TonB-dependent receptor plug domain-containing protein [Bacteroidota bacterium]
MKFSFIISVLCIFSNIVYAQQHIPADDSLHKAKDSLEEVTVVASTRGNQKIETSPMKVEVLGLEEMKEEAGIKPGNIASILGDVSGVQIQQTSVASGNSNVRIQGLDGKYTQILRDGMPMYDGFAGGFGILTIPPLDLKQIELVKGAASTLYGGGAIAGLVNLISKRPMFRQELDALVNYTSLQEFNANIYASKRNQKIGYNFFAGYNNQQAVDVNKDGFSDVGKSNSFLIHPKLFFYPDDKTVVAIGYSGSFDTRKGGDMQVLQNNADSIHKYYEGNISTRHTGEYLIERYLNNTTKFTLKGNLSFFDRTINTNTYTLNGRQTSMYHELSASFKWGVHDMVIGFCFSSNNYKTIYPYNYIGGRDGYSGIFAQSTWHVKKQTLLETGVRMDITDGTNILLPRLAVFHPFNNHWATRAGFGMGYKTPNPLTTQTIENNILNIKTGGNVLPELSYGYNAEVNYKKDWDKEHSFFINQAFFLTHVYRPSAFVTDTVDGKMYLQTMKYHISSAGFDTYIKLQLSSWELYAGYTFTDARYIGDTINRSLPITPKHRWAFVLVKEWDEKWRIGLEGSYTGSQYRYDGTGTPSYLFIALMGQCNIGKHISIVLNCENLLDYRMSNVETLYTGTISNPSFKPLWAPIDGRVINLSFRWHL